MKSTVVLLLVASYLLLSFRCQSQDKKEDLVANVYEGRTPCRELAKQLKEEVTKDCLKIKWRLILYLDSTSGKPGKYKLVSFAYQRDNPQIGEWHIVKGTTADPTATVYQLDQPGKEPLLFQKADENVLFFLDKRKNLMVGNKDFSYALNRVKKKL